MSGAFTSGSPAGLKLWLKADSLVLSNNDPVGTWADQSGNGNNFTQGTAGNKPLYKTGIINGLPAVLFDGTDDFMSMTGAPCSQPVTIFLVVQPSLNTASQKTYATFCHGITGGNSGWFIVAKLSTNFWGSFTTADFSSGNALTSGTNYLLGNAADGSTYGAILYQAGSQVATNGNTEVGVGTNAGLGKDLVNSNREYAGYIAEYLVYNSTLTQSNRIKVQNYLISKYAL